MSDRVPRVPLVNLSVEELRLIMGSLEVRRAHAVDARLDSASVRERRSLDILVEDLGKLHAKVDRAIRAMSR